MLTHTHKRQGRRLTRRLFSGGIDPLCDDAAQPEDRLRDAENVWWKEGVLRTRPGFTLETSRYSLTSVKSAAIAQTDCQYNQTDGRLITLVHTVSDGFALAAYFCSYEGEIALIRRVSSADWSACPNHVLIVPGEDERALLYIDGVPYALSNDGNLTKQSPYIPLIHQNVRGYATYAQAAAHDTLEGDSNEPTNRLTEAFRLHYQLEDGRLYYPLPRSCRKRAGTLSVQFDGAEVFTYQVTSPDGKTVVHAPTSSLETLSSLYWSPARGVFWFGDENDSTAVTLDPTLWGNPTVCFVPAVDSPTGMQPLKNASVAIRYGSAAEGSCCFLGGGGNTIVFSAPQNACYFPTDNTLAIGRPDCAVTALRQQGDKLIIFTEQEIWCASRRSSQSQSATVSLSLVAVSHTVGCRVPASIALCNTRLVWMGGDRQIYAMTGGNLYSERQPYAVGHAVYNRLTALSNDELAQAVAVAYDGHYLLVAGEEAWLFDYERAEVNSATMSTITAKQKQVAWFRWHIDGLPVWNGAFAHGDRLVGVVLSTSRALCQLKTCSAGGSTDWLEGNGRDIPVWLQLPLLDAGEPSRTKTLHRLTIDTDRYESALQVTLQKNRRSDHLPTYTLATNADGQASMIAGLKRVKVFSLSISAPQATTIYGITFHYSVDRKET